MAVYIVTGTPGVGKTLVLGKAIEKSRGKFKVLTYGSLMLEVAEQLGLADDRDKLRYLEKEKMDRIRSEAAKRIASEGGDVILDTHCSVKTPNGYAPGLPYGILTKINPETIILVEGKPDEIVARRNKDQENGLRNRSDFGGINDVIRHQDINRAYGAAYSAITGCSIAIILNEQGKADEAAEKMRKVLKI